LCQNQTDHQFSLN